MKKLLAILLFCGMPSLCHAQTQFDLSFPNGLTVAMYGASSYSCPDCNLPQGYAFVRFSENLNLDWFANCLSQQFYIHTTASGKLLYQSLLLAQVTGKKVTRMVVNKPLATGYNVCTLDWAQIQ